MTSGDALALSGNIGIAIYALLLFQCFASPGRFRNYGRLALACATAYATYATVIRMIGLYGALAPTDASIINGFASYVFSLVIGQHAIIWRKDSDGST